MYFCFLFLIFDFFLETLTDKQLQEKEKLIKQGFYNWTKKEFLAFCKACEYYGRDAFDDIAAEIGTKTAEEVRAYSKVFWKKLKFLNGIFYFYFLFFLFCLYSFYYF